MQEPIYREFAPPPALRAFVRCVWRFESDCIDEAPQHIAPDGRPEAIFHLGAPYFEGPPGDGAQQPPFLFAGQLTKPLLLHARAPARVLGVRFEPDGARDFLGAPMRTATDQRLDLSRLHGPRVRALHDELRAARTCAAQRAAACRYVLRVLSAAGARIEPLVRHAISALVAGEQVTAAGLGVSERRLQRLFAERVGAPPRMMAAIFRFRRVFDAIESPSRPDWVATALEAGYFDQPQMARDFRRFLGTTARFWAAQRVGLARALTMRDAAASG